METSGIRGFQDLHITAQDRGTWIAMESQSSISCRRKTDS